MRNAALSLYIHVQIQLEVIDFDLLLLDLCKVIKKKVWTPFQALNLDATKIFFISFTNQFIWWKKLINWPLFDAYFHKRLSKA